MNSLSILKNIFNNTRAKEILEWPFDFRVCEPYLLSSSWPISVSEELLVVAEDGTGGVYTIKDNIDPDLSPVIFISSEGQAGKVANHLIEFLAIIVALPYWRDLLKFSAGGKLEEMCKASFFLARDMHEDDPEIDDKKKIIIESIGLPDISEPIQTLFNSVNSGTVVEIKASDGTLYGSLFNTFSVSDNRMWR